MPDYPSLKYRAELQRVMPGSESGNSSSLREALFRFAASSVGSVVAETVTLPTDVAKTRLQVQTDARYSGFANCLITIRREEGTRALWKGLAPALLRQVCYSSLSLVLYEPVRNGYGTLFRAAGLANQDNSGKPSFLERLLAGGTAGALSISVFNPTEVLKTKIMTSSTQLTMREVIREVYAKDGLRGFWAGISPNISRTFLVNAAELGTYDQAKSTLVPYVGDGFVSFLGASATAGLASALTSTPVDVVKTRMMNMAGGQQAYSSMASGLVTIAREEGAAALYKGFIPIFVRKLVWCSSFFVVYEFARKEMRDKFPGTGTVSDSPGQ